MQRVNKREYSMEYKRKKNGALRLRPYLKDVEEFKKIVDLVKIVIEKFALERKVSL